MAAVVQKHTTTDHRYPFYPFSYFFKITKFSINNRYLLVELPCILTSGTSHKVFLCHKMEGAKHEQLDDEELIETIDFDWTAYIENNDDVEASPESAFSHVEASLDNGVKEGMIVEKPLDSTGKVFWLASIDSVFGPLLKLTWLGDENLEEMWHDLSKERIYPLGYCQMNKVTLEPPLKVAEMCPLWRPFSLQYLEDATFDTVSMHFLDDEGITPTERIRPGMGVYVQDSQNSYTGKIIANYGGLLHLRNHEDNAGGQDKDEFIFYNSPKILPLKSNCDLKKPPSDLIKQVQDSCDFSKDEELEIIIDGHAYKGNIVENKHLKVRVGKKVHLAPNYAICPAGTFLEKQPLPRHVASKSKFPKMTSAEELGFEAGQKLMILLRKKEFHPCTIIKSVNHFLKLSIDTIKEEYICSVHDPIIFPLSWPQTHGLKSFIRLVIYY